MTINKGYHGTKKKKSLAAKYLEIVVVVSIYWIVSISMVFLNKQLLSSRSVNLDAPLFVTLFQCLCSCGICIIAGMASKRSQKLAQWIPIKVDTFNLATLVSVLPLSLMFVCMITFNNLCLKYVGVAFYFVGRSLTTVFNVVLTYIVLGQKTSPPAIVCCLVIIFGFFLGVDQEGDSGSLSVIGVIYGVLASLFVSLSAIHTKKTLALVDNSVWLLSFYNNVNSIILLFILMIITGEVPAVASFEKLNDIGFWLLMTTSGLFGFAIGFVTALQIQVTTPLTHNISGTAKACAQTVLAVIWFQENKTILWFFSNFLVMIASAVYARVKQLEMAKTHASFSRVKEEDIEKLLSEDENTFKDSQV